MGLFDKHSVSFCLGLFVPMDGVGQSLGSLSETKVQDKKRKAEGDAQGADVNACSASCREYDCCVLRGGR